MRSNTRTLAALAAVLVALVAPSQGSARPPEPGSAGGTAAGRAAQSDQRLPRGARPCPAARLHRVERGRRRPLRTDGAARLLQPRLGQRAVVLRADRAGLLPAGIPQLVGRREPRLGRARHRRLARVPALALEPAAPREPARTPAGARSDSAPSTRRAPPASTAAVPRRSSPPTSAPAPDSAYPLRAGACSSVEERRPSKPLVGGSNPPRRIALNKPKPASPGGFRRLWPRLVLPLGTAKNRSGLAPTGAKLAHGRDERRRPGEARPRVA